LASRHQYTPGRIARSGSFGGLGLSKRERRTKQFDDEVLTLLGFRGSREDSWAGISEFGHQRRSIPRRLIRSTNRRQWRGKRKLYPLSRTSDSQNSRTLANPPIGVAGNPPRPPEHHADADNSSQLPSWWRRNLEVLKFVGEMIILVVTICIACIYSGQLHQMIESNKINHSAVFGSQRPWVGFAKNAFNINAVSIFPDSAKGHEGQVVVSTGVSIELENFGNSPALHVSPPTFVVKFTEKQIPPNDWKTLPCQSAAENISKQELQTYFIMPKSTVLTTASTMQGTPGNVVDLHNLWLMGCVVYQDSIDWQVHHTVILLYSAYSSAVQFSPKSLGIWASDTD
jgi:hypothetical protein